MLTTMTVGPMSDPFYDPEDERWKRYFGESYIEDDYHSRDTDEKRLMRIEADFFDAVEGDRAPFGRLYEVEE